MPFHHDAVPKYCNLRRSSQMSLQTVVRLKLPVRPEVEDDGLIFFVQSYIRGVEDIVRKSRRTRMLSPRSYTTHEGSNIKCS
jgi:hypothetical protein